MSITRGDLLHGIAAGTVISAGARPLAAFAAGGLPQVFPASSTGLVYICNPNNPTGTLTPRKNLESLITKLPAEVMILIDEAYQH
jgi:histidinol-phosphate aminotransferase